MKKRIIALLLVFGMMFENIGSITSYAEQIQDNEVIEEVAPDSQVEFEEDFQEENKNEEMPQEGNTSAEEMNEEPTNLAEEVAESEDTPVQESTDGFHGEINVDEHAISVVDKDGNVSYIDVSGDDTIVGETSTFRTASSQIVNLRKTSGVLEYTEVETGEGGYVAGAYGADAAYLGESNGKVKFMLAGVIGQIDASKVEVVGMNNAKSVSYYAVSNGRLHHYISTNVKIENYGSVLDNGPAPSYLKSGTKYYSYDGHYFYTESNFGNMIDDYNKGTRAHSINSNNPYYNYFQYLPLRSQSNYSSSTLNTIINNKVTANSKMKNTGSEFVKKQNTYGVNALLIAGLAANESAWGSSNIAQKKNNLFGLNAVDSSPGQSANYFASVEQCINEFAEKWMSKEYLNPKNWKYFGGFLGNKASGMNVKYASDPYWGEKAASMAWNLDKANGNKDANKYTIGIKDVIGPENTVNIRKDSNTTSTVLFKSPKQGNCAYIVLNQTPVNEFYKIQSDGVLNSGRTAINSGSGVYDFANMYAHISSDYVKIVSKGNGSESDAGSDSSSENWKVNGIKTSIVAPQLMNSEITLTADVSGDVSSLEYKFVWMKNDWKEWGVIRNFSTKKDVIWKPTSEGEYTLYLDVKKGTGDSTTVHKSYHILDWSYDGISTSLSSPQLMGKQISLSANVGGKINGLRYKFIWEKDGWKEWGVIQNFSTKNKASWKPIKAGDYVLHVDVCDMNGYTFTMKKEFKINNLSWKWGDLLTSSSKVEIGKEVTLTQKIESSIKELPLEYKFVWQKDGWKEWGVIRGFSTKNSVKWIPEISGECTIVVDVKDSTGEVKTKSKVINIEKGNWKYVKINPDKKAPQYVGEKINMEVKTEGNAYGVQYKFVWQKDNWRKWGVIQNFSLKNCADWIPQEEGDYKILVDIRDLSGKITTHSIEYKVLRGDFNSIQIIPATKQTVGGKIHIKADYKGSTSGMQYKFVWEKDEWKEWGVIRGFSSKNSVDWIPKKVGKYTIHIDILNSKGNIEKKSTVISVGQWDYESITISKKGDNVFQVQPIIKGNTSGFEYKYVWQKNNWKEWGVLKSFSSNSMLEWKPKTKGTYTICVDVKDGNGKVITRQNQYVVK